MNRGSTPRPPGLSLFPASPISLKSRMFPSDFQGILNKRTGVWTGYETAGGGDGHEAIRKQGE